MVNIEENWKQGMLSLDINIVLPLAIVSEPFMYVEFDHCQNQCRRSYNIRNWSL